jgi:hypothetical protein
MGCNEVPAATPTPLIVSLFLSLGTSLRVVPVYRCTGENDPSSPQNGPGQKSVCLIKHRKGNLEQDRRVNVN